MQARAEQSKNRILDELAAAIARAREGIYEALVLLSIVVLVIVVVLVMLVAAGCGNLTLFCAIFIYLIVTSLIYLQFTRNYTRKKLLSAERTLNNFLASEEAIRILNDTAAVYNTTPA